MRGRGPTHREWLLAHLAHNGRLPKSAVVAAWRRAFPGRPLNSLEVAFSRAKRQGLVTGEVSEFRGPSVWRLLEPGEAPFIWKRRGPVRRRVSVVRDGVYRPPWGAGTPNPKFWAHDASDGPLADSAPRDGDQRRTTLTDDDLRRLARERALARIAFG